MEDVKVIIDTDPGTDDCAAITHFLTHTNVIAITTVFGNISLDTASNNACRILNHLGYDHVPVYTGAHCKLAGVNLQAAGAGDIIHGADGLNNTDVVPQKVDKFPEEDKSGPAAIIDLVKKYPGEIVLVAIGPLTNIAIASKLCPEFPKLLKAMYIMGGSTYKGNVTPWAEFNFHCDPLAAHVSLQHLCKDTLVHLVPWETCLENRLDFPTFHDIFKDCETPAGLLLKSTAMTGYQKDSEEKGEGYCFADQFISLTFLHPESVLRKECYDTAQVNTNAGDAKYGLAEYIRVNDVVAAKNKGLVVYTKYDMKMMAKLFVNAIKMVR